MMNRLDRSYFIFLIFLGILAFFPVALPFSFSIDPTSADFFATIPFALENWEGHEVPVDDRTYEILETRNVLSRLYENRDGETIHLLVVASHKDRRVAHPPEVCYLSSNYTILDEKEDALYLENEEVPLKEFVAKHKTQPSQAERVFYVYKVGRKFTTNYFTQQLQFAWDRVTRQESQVLLIRLAGAEESPFKEFLSEILPHLS